MRKIVCELLLFGAGLVLATAHATEVGQRGSWQRMEFRGLETLDAESIRAALATDLDWQIAACATAPLDDLVVTTRERLEEGFRYSGYPKAKVEVEFDPKEDRLVVTVDEGRHLTAGKVSISAPEWLDQLRLKQSIESGTERSAWKIKWNREDVVHLKPSRVAKACLAGERIPLHKSTQGELRRALRIASAEQGLLLSESQIGVELQHQGSAVDLQISLPQEAPQGHFNTVQVLGLSRHSAEEVMEYLDIAPGMPFDSVAVDRVCHKLRESCRFWNYEVTVQIAAPEEGGRYVVEEPEVHLVIDVVEYEMVPKLGEALSELDQALLRTANWAEDYVKLADSSGDDLVLEMRGHLNDFEGKADICLSPTQGLIVSLTGSAGDRVVDETFRSDLERLTLLGWHQAQCFNFEGLRLILSMHLKPLPRTDAKYTKHVGWAFRMEREREKEQRGPHFEANIVPVALIETVREMKPRSEIKEEEIILTTSAMRLVIERRSGRILELTRHGETVEGVGGTLRMHLSDAEYDRTVATAQERAEGLPEHRYSLVKKSNLGTIEADQAFNLPPSAALSGAGVATSGWFQCADEWVPRGSWAWACLRELQLSGLQKHLSVSQLGVRSEEFQRLVVQSDDIGPVGYYLLARHYGADPGYSRYFAKRGLATLRDDGLTRDMVLLANENLLAVQLAAALLRDCDSIESSPLWSLSVILLPPEAADPLYRLFAQKVALPEENLTGALAGTVMDLWDDHLEQAVEKELMRLAEAPPASAARAKVATKSNPKQPNDKAAPPPAPGGGLFDSSENGDLWKAID